MKHLKRFETLRHKQISKRKIEASASGAINYMKQHGIDPMEPPYDADTDNIYEKGQPTPYFMRYDELEDTDLWEEMIKMNPKIYLYILDEYSDIEYGFNAHDGHNNVVKALNQDDDYLQELAIKLDPSIISEIKERGKLSNKVMKKISDNPETSHISDSDDLGLL